jgi:hypothetical protein
VFKAIDYLLFQNRKELDSEILEEFHPYMVGRYLSMYGEEFVPYVNETINRYGNIFDTKEEQLLFYEQVIPKLKRKKIDYFSRPKKDVADDFGGVPEFLSKRELEEYLKMDI